MSGEKTTLEYIELNEANVSDETVQEFDCGNDDMNEYLYYYAKDDSVYGRGVTYVLVADDRKRIYAYATLKAHSLYYYEEAEKHYTKPMTGDGKVLMAMPAAEIKMFAISKQLIKRKAYPFDPSGERHYSTIFFKWFLEKIYYMSMTVIGFNMVFLRANNEGYGLYKKFGFVECEDYMDTYDEKAEGCTSMAIAISDLEYGIFAD